MIEKLLTSLCKELINFFQLYLTLLAAIFSNSALTLLELNLTLLAAILSNSALTLLAAAQH